jgi:hypothetical protein
MSRMIDLSVTERFVHVNAPVEFHYLHLHQRAEAANIVRTGNFLRVSYEAVHPEINLMKGVIWETTSGTIKVDLTLSDPGSPKSPSLHDVKTSDLPVVLRDRLIRSLDD